MTILAPDENRPPPLPWVCARWFNCLPLFSWSIRRFKWLSAVSAFDCLLSLRGIFHQGLGFLEKPSSMCDRSRSRSPVGTRRGIRGGGAARRKRLAAWIQHNLDQGVQWDDIPVAHSGGQQRPSCTLRPLGNLRAVTSLRSNGVCTRSFDLSIKASFSVRSRSLDSKA